jgi:hypothetical protein
VAQSPAVIWRTLEALSDRGLGAWLSRLRLSGGPWRPCFFWLSDPADSWCARQVGMSEAPDAQALKANQEADAQALKANQEAIAKLVAQQVMEGMKTTVHAEVHRLQSAKLPRTMEQCSPPAQSIFSSSMNEGIQSAAWRSVKKALEAHNAFLMGKLGVRRAGRGGGRSRRLAGSPFCPRRRASSVGRRSARWADRGRGVWSARRGRPPLAPHPLLATLSLTALVAVRTGR